MRRICAVTVRTSTRSCVIKALGRGRLERLLEEAQASHILFVFILKFSSNYYSQPACQRSSYARKAVSSKCLHDFSHTNESINKQVFQAFI